MEDLASGPILVGTKRHPFAMAITSPPSQAMARRGEASPHAPPQSDALGKAPTIQLHAAALFGPKKKKKNTTNTTTDLPPPALDKTPNPQINK